MKSSITRPNIANGATILPILPAPKNWPGSTRSAKPSWVLTGAGIRLQVVEAGKSSNSMAHGWQPIGSHHVKVHLKAGETKKIIFILGYHENPREAKFDPPGSQTINKKTVKPIIAKYLQPKNVESAFKGFAGLLDGTARISCR